jgi:sugar/nucleoside kinase (ribokinase family)
VTAAAKAFYLPGLYYGHFFKAGLYLLRLKRMKVIMDGNIGEDVTLASGAVRNAIKSVDVFMPNAREARLLTGEDDLRVALEILGGLCPLVIIKDGCRGAYAKHAGQTYHVPAMQVTPLDTTGAGDCFSAGFVKSWLEGQPLLDCLRWGCVVGALSTLGLGGTGYHVSAREVEERLIDYSGQPDVP